MAAMTDANVEKKEAIQVGSLCELHSLSRADLNGKRGFILAWMLVTERFSVELESGKTVAVRRKNLLRAPPPPREARERAHASAQTAFDILKELRTKQHVGDFAVMSADALEDFDPHSAPMVRAKMLLSEADQHDPTGELVLSGHVNYSWMTGDLVERLKYIRRAIAAAERTSEPLFDPIALRMQLASTIGDPRNPKRDVEEEEAQLRFVLRAAPGNINARLQMGLNLMDRGRADEAIAELMMALQLPEGDHGIRGIINDQPTNEHVRTTACKNLGQILAARAARRSSAMDHAGAVRDLEQLLRLDPSRMPKEEAARCELNLALSLSGSGRLGDAAAAIERARAHAPQKRQLRSMLQRVASTVLYEHAGDALLGGGVYDKPPAAIELYAQAKEGYRAANAICEDHDAREGFGRVQAKMHPETTFTVNMDGSVAVSLRAGSSATGLSFEQLPQGPPSDIDGWGEAPHYPAGFT